MLKAHEARERVEFPRAFCRGLGPGLVSCNAGLAGRDDCTIGERRPNPSGFTLIELMIVVVIIGILAAIALPNFSQLRERANEGGTKTNMHTVQLHAEDYGVLNDGVYSDVIDIGHIASALPTAFANPYDGTQGDGAAWENRDVYAAQPSATTGIVSYADSATSNYNVKGQSRNRPVTLVLSSQ